MVDDDRVQGKLLQLARSWGPYVSCDVDEPEFLRRANVMREFVNACQADMTPGSHVEFTTAPPGIYATDTRLRWIVEVRDLIRDADDARVAHGVFRMSAQHMYGTHQHIGYVAKLVSDPEALF